MLPLSAARTAVVVSDRVDLAPSADGAGDLSCLEMESPWPPPDRDWSRDQVVVEGGYLERLPLSLVRAGVVDHVEIWHHVLGGAPRFHRTTETLAYRSFAVDPGEAPYRSAAMEAFFERFGAPHVLIVLGLGLDAAHLAQCAASMRIYNSIDAPSLRVPPEVSGHFDLILTGAQWQSDEVLARHPDMLTCILPIGPEFAAPDMFRPLSTAKDYDLIYVAAAQPYKRHDILFDALDRLPRDVRALCVFGYGELADALRDDAGSRGLSIDFVGPPGVSFPEVDRLMNLARFGVVCGRDDGAPAILTEYMLAGLPVLANSELVCGRQFILPETGMLSSAGEFADAIMIMRQSWSRFAPRNAVLERWTWPHSSARLVSAIQDAEKRKNLLIT